MEIEDYPRTQAELERRFSNEQACREYLFAVRWPSGFHLSPLRDGQSLASGFRTLAVRRLRPPDHGFGGNSFSGYEDAVDGVVSGHVVDDESEERGQRAGSSAGAWMGQLPDGLDVSA